MMIVHMASVTVSTAVTSCYYIKIDARRNSCTINIQYTGIPYRSLTSVIVPVASKSLYCGTKINFERNDH